MTQSVPVLAANTSILNTPSRQNQLLIELTSQTGCEFAIPIGLSDHSIHFSDWVSLQLHPLIFSNLQLEMHGITNSRPQLNPVGRLVFIKRFFSEPLKMAWSGLRLPRKLAITGCRGFNAQFGGIYLRYSILLGFLFDMPYPQYPDKRFGNKVSYAYTVFFKSPWIAVVIGFKFVNRKLQRVGR